MCISHLFMDAKKQLPFQSIFRYLLHCWNLWELLKSEVKPMGQVSLQMSPAQKGCLPTSAVHGWSGDKPLQGFLSTRKGIEKGLGYLLLGYIYICVHTYVRSRSAPSSQVQTLSSCPRSQSPLSSYCWCAIYPPCKALLARNQREKQLVLGVFREANPLE